MKSSKFILRLVQLFTALIIVGTLGMLLTMSGVISWDAISPFKHSAADTQNAKVKRPKDSGSKNGQDLINSGDRAYFAGNYDKALSFYQSASEASPRESLPYEKIGDLNLLQAKFDSALQNFRLAFTLAPQNQSLVLKSVRCLLGLRKIEDANAELAKIDPETPDSLYYKGVIAAALNKGDDAQALLNKSRSSSTDPKLTKKIDTIMSIYQLYGIAEEAPAEYLQTLLAQGMDQNGEYGLAIALAFDAIKSDHNYRDAWITLGHSFLNEKKWLDADDALTKAIDLDSNHPAPYFFRGIARHHLKKPTDALADFSTASRLGFKPEILVKQQLADTYFDLGNLEKAYPLYKDVAMSDPSDINVFVRPMALAINHLNKFAEAISLARKASETHPDTAMAENLLGWAAMANDDFSAAHDHFNEALKRDPELAAAYLNLGMLYEKEGNRDLALQNYDKAKTLAEDFGDESIGNTAEVRYNQINNQPQTPMEQPASSNGGTQSFTSPTPQSGSNIPSLSLQ